MKHLIFALLFGNIYCANGQTVGETKTMLNNYMFIQDTAGEYSKQPLTISNVVGGWIPPQTGTLIHLVSANSGNGRFSFDSYNSSNVQGSIIQGRRSRGTYDSPLPPDSGDVLIAIGGDGMGISGFHNVSTGVATIRAENTFTQTSAPSYFSVGLATSGSITQTEKFRIRSTGQMLFTSGFYSSGIMRVDGSGNSTSSALTGAEINSALGYTPLSSYTETDPQFDTKFSTKSTTALSEGTNLYYTAGRFNTSFSGKSTTDLGEGTNLYYTAARFNTAFSGKSTSDLTEGSNLYYTSTRFNTSFSGKNTDGLTEGSTNVYYTTARFSTAFSTKSTTDLTEGSNLYFTNARSRTAISLTTTGSGAASYNNSTGVLNVPTPSGKTFNNAPSITIQTVASAGNGNQLSTTQDAYVTYSATIVSTATIAGNASGYVVLEICPTNSATAANWIEISRVSNGQAVSLAIVLQAVSTGGGAVNGVIPAGYYRRVRSIITAGSPVFSYASGQEVLQ